MNEPDEDVISWDDEDVNDEIFAQLCDEQYSEDE